MARFTNDLSLYISTIEHEEIMESLNKKYARQRKEMCLKTAIVTGGVVVASAISAQQNKPEVMLLTMASLALANSVYDLYIKNRQFKKYQINYTDLENIDYRNLARTNRERDRINGKLKHTAPYRYELENKEEIEEEFGYPSDNDLPIHFLELELVPERILHEYEMYGKRYQVPELKIDKETLVEFTNQLSKLLKKVNMSHRIYYYTSEYFRRLTSKGIINYWDEITLDTLINNIDIFTSIELTEEDIKSFKESFKKEEKTKKLK